MDHTFEQEQQHLTDIYGQLVHMRDALSAELETSHKGIAQDLIDMSEEIRPDFVGADETMETLAAIETLNSVIDTYNQIHDFTVDKLTLSGELTDRISGFVSEDSFAHFLFLSGEGRIACGGDDLYFRKGDSFFLPAGSGDYSITGTCEALVTTERAKDGAHESEVV